MFGPVLSHTKESKPATTTLTAFKSEEPSLSELNPLFHPLDLQNSGSVEAFKSVTLSLADKYRGLQPSMLKTLVVSSESPNVAPALRFIAQFEVTGLTRRKIKGLESLVKHTYGADARTTTTPDGVELPATRYPHADTQTIDEMVNTRLEGWYMGANSTHLDTLHQGLYLFRDVGVTNSRNFLRETQAKNPKYLVEIREADLFQTDLANLIVETA